MLLLPVPLILWRAESSIMQEATIVLNSANNVGPSIRFSKDSIKLIASFKMLPPKLSGMGLFVKDAWTKSKGLSR